MKQLLKLGITFAALTFTIMSFVIPNINHAKNEILERTYTVSYRQHPGTEAEKDSLQSTLSSALEVDSTLNLEEQKIRPEEATFNLEQTTNTDSIMVEELELTPLIYSRSIQFVPKIPPKNLVQQQKAQKMESKPVL